MACADDVAVLHMMLIATCLRAQKAREELCQRRAGLEAALGPCPSRTSETVDALLDVELARVEEGPETTLVGLGQDGAPHLAEDERDDDEEQLRDGEARRAEVEDLAEDGREACEAESCGR